jgi:hypothetical protein
VWCHLGLPYSDLYRPRMMRHRVAAYAAKAAVESWLCWMAPGSRNPCLSKVDASFALAAPGLKRKPWGPQSGMFGNPALCRSTARVRGRRRHTLPPPLPALRPLVAATEYDAWQRGRVVHERAPARFVVYADRQLLSMQRLTRVRAAFSQPPQGPHRPEVEVAAGNAVAIACLRRRGFGHVGALPRASGRGRAHRRVLDDTHPNDLGTIPRSTGRIGPARPRAM